MIAISGQFCYYQYRPQNIVCYSSCSSSLFIFNQIWSVYYSKVLCVLIPGCRCLAYQQDDFTVARGLDHTYENNECKDLQEAVPLCSVNNTTLYCAHCRPTSCFCLWCTNDKKDNTKWDVFFLVAYHFILNYNRNIQYVQECHSAQ